MIGPAFKAASPTAPFPLGLVSTLSVDSRHIASVRFCDILAGLSVKMHGATPQSPDYAFFTELQSAGLSALTLDGITPLLVFPDQIPPRKLEGSDVVDQLATTIQQFEGRRVEAKPPFGDRRSAKLASSREVTPSQHSECLLSRTFGHCTNDRSEGSKQPLNELVFNVDSEPSSALVSRTKS